jgi:predicted nucleic-acid-binding Zn-ribbon protein
MRRGSCPKCGSAEILSEVEVGPRNEPAVFLRRYKRPGQVFFAGPQYAELRAWVCLGCGYTELYTAEPRNLGTADNEKT